MVPCFYPLLWGIMVTCAKTGIYFRARNLEPDGVIAAYYQRIAVVGLGRG